MRVRCLSAVLLCACAGRAAAPVAEEAEEEIVRVGPPAKAAWALAWRGQAIGGAWERDSGAHFERRERIVVRRGEEVVISDLAITIERDERGVPYQVGVTRWQQGPVLDGTAMRTVDGGWSVELEGEPPAKLPAAAPFELVLREGQPFRGDVMLAGWGFAIAHLDLDPSARAARLFVGGRLLEATVTYDDDGAVASVVGGDGITATRAAFDADLRPARPPEVVDGNAISVAGHGTTVTFVEASPPWSAALDAATPRDLQPERRTRDRSDEITALVHRVAREIADDLASTATTTGAALTATHGDCTTHALRFAALAAEARIPARVVTGLRLDEGALVRHRWNLAWTGARWITVDPTFDEAPASAALVGLAVHGARAADLAAADATVFDGLGTRADLR
jgi:transglutaminase-like putative cysteine protease